MAVLFYRPASSSCNRKMFPVKSQGIFFFGERIEGDLVGRSSSDSNFFLFLVSFEIKEYSCS